jgi:hypothetical protein
MMRMPDLILRDFWVAGVIMAGLDLSAIIHHEGTAMFALCSFVVVDTSRSGDEHS